MANAYPWLNLNRITKKWGGSTNKEYGIDIGMPVGTRITSLTSGKVVGFGYYWGGGVVTVRGIVNGTLGDLYYQHLDLIASNIVKGMVIHPGDLIGYSGGQCDGSGHHPSKYTPGCGPHIEVGINPPWFGIWGPGPHPGKNYDPEPWLRKVAAGQGDLPGSGLQTGPGGAFGSTDIAADYTKASGFGNRVALVIGPNDDVTQILVDMDSVFEIFNPFVVTGIDHVYIGGLDTGIERPGPYIAGIFYNFLIMMFALVVRPLFILIGALIILKLLFTFIDKQAATETGFQAARLATVLK